MRNILILSSLLLSLTFMSCGNIEHKEDTIVRVINKATKEPQHGNPGTSDTSLVHGITTHPLPQSYSKLFNDSNAIQLTAADKIGIQPITDLKTAYHLRKPVVYVATCNEYYIDELTHSMPYLVPEAERLLKQIGKEFTDSVISRGGSKYQIKVTSLMRTSNSVGNLKKRNRNATQQSCHMYGTTFDISYAKFIPNDSSYIISLADLKNVLAEILYKKQKEGKCYVKYEVKQGCFHITACS